MGRIFLVFRLAGRDLRRFFRQPSRVVGAVAPPLLMWLLIGSGLMLRTFRALRGVEPGFRSASTLQTLRIYVPETQVKEPERVLRMEQEILNRMATLPGVSSVAVTNNLPMQGGQQRSRLLG